MVMKYVNHTFIFLKTNDLFDFHASNNKALILSCTALIPLATSKCEHVRQS